MSEQQRDAQLIAQMRRLADEREAMAADDTCPPEVECDNCDTVRALRDGASALESLTYRWRPIETAPKDGTVFYINHPLGIRRAWWCGDGARLYYESPGRGEMVDDEIAHWMPLPAVPDAQKPGE